MNEFLEDQKRQQEEYNLWLGSLQPGQPCVVRISGKYHVAKVDRLTRSQFVVKTGFAQEMRFRREDGRRVGGGYDKLEKETRAIRDAMNSVRLQQWLSGLTYRGEFPSLAHLKAMKRAYDRVTHELANPVPSVDSQQNPSLSL